MIMRGYIFSDVESLARGLDEMISFWVSLSRTPSRERRMLQVWGRADLARDATRQSGEAWRG